MERDFFADFLGVLERDLLDRFGVRGEGDLGGKKHDISVNKENGKITTRLALMTKWADSFTSLMTFCCWIAGNLYGTSGMMCL